MCPLPDRSSDFGSSATIGPIGSVSFPSRECFDEVARGKLISADLPKGALTLSDAHGPHLPDDLSEVMDFSGYDLRTTIRLIVLSGESRRIEVRRGSRSGSIFIKDGEICAALTDIDRGDEAFFEILAWKQSTHSDAHEPDPPERNLRISTSVLLDTMRIQTT